MPLNYTPELAAIVLRGVSVSVSPQCDRAHWPKLKIGETYNSLTVISDIPKHERNARFWLCRCVCGNTKYIETYHLRAKTIQSCGCAWTPTIKHGEARVGKESAEYKLWKSMRRRCHSPKDKNYGYYGGRGIAVHGRWRNSFAAFLADVGRRPFPGLTLDRIDNNGNYEPGNVRWATRLDQARNKRNTSLVTFNGQAKGIREWLGLLNISNSAYYPKVRRGLAPEQALAECLASPRHGVGGTKRQSLDTTLHDRETALLLLAGGARMMQPEPKHVTALADFMEAE